MLTQDGKSTEFAMQDSLDRFEIRLHLEFVLLCDFIFLLITTLNSSSKLWWELRYKLASLMRIE